MIGEVGTAAWWLLQTPLVWAPLLTASWVGTFMLGVNATCNHRKP